MTEEWRLLHVASNEWRIKAWDGDPNWPGDTIADVYTTESDARMMAAAPKMAKALKMLLSKSIVELEQGDPWVEVRAALNAAGVEI
jgi:hypothetical protein